MAVAFLLDQGSVFRASYPSTKIPKRQKKNFRCGLLSADTKLHQIYGKKSRRARTHLIDVQPKGGRLGCSALQHQFRFLGVVATRGEQGLAAFNRNSLLDMRGTTCTV